jgi:arsenate reductase
MAEAMMNHPVIGLRRFRAYSAGSHPRGTVDPLALEELVRRGISTDGLRSKSWDEFAGPEAPHLHFVFTVCDQAAAEQCPVWPGAPMTAQWTVPDPAAVTSSDNARRRAFRDAALILARRIELFTQLPLTRLSNLALRQRLDEIGHIR